jgi:membrane protein
VGHVWQVTHRAVGRFFADGCPKLAAAISYYSLFALVPLMILGVAVLGVVFGDDDVRDAFIQGILEALPLRPEQGRSDLEQVLREVTQGAGSAGVVALALLAVSASGIMGAVRFALNAVFRVPDERPPVTGKLLDVLAVLGVGIVLAASLGVTIIAREAGFSRIVVGEIVPAGLAFGVYLLLLRTVPALRRPLRDLWVGALIGAVGYALAKLAFLSYVGGITTVYASLAAIIAFLVFFWITANLFLLGAEVAAAQAELREGVDEPGPDEPVTAQLRRALRGTVLRPPPSSPEGAPAERR